MPPVTQVTTVVTTHLTLHHRNRSLDSALQRIPEVDITPSPECESSNVIGMQMTGHAISSCVVSSPVSKNQRDELASLGSDDSGILCGSDAGSSGSSEANATRESSVEYLTSATQSRESLDDVCVDGEVKCVSTSSSHGDILDCENSLKSDTTKDKCKNEVEHTVQLPKPSMGYLLRLLESKFFDVPMAIQYLFQSKEPGVQSYIANKMFSYPYAEVDFYLPQLVCMYIQMHDVAKTIHPYLVHRYVPNFIILYLCNSPTTSVYQTLQMFHRVHILSIVDYIF